MRLVISDTSCLIDLKKGTLLEAFVRLPYELAIPDVLWYQEVVQFTDVEKAILVERLTILSLPGPSVVKVRDIQRQNPALTLNDCFAFVLAEQNTGCILLTGDGRLRKLSQGEGIEVHGLLWIIDEIHAIEAATVAHLYAALQTLEADATVWLPKAELKKSLDKFKRLL